MSWRVPLTDLGMPADDVAAVLDALRDGWLMSGPRTELFEAAFAAYVGCRHAVAVSSGTAALHLACLIAGLGPRDEVIVPGLAFASTAAAPRYVGARPVLCEVRGPHDMTIDPDDVAARIGARTRAVIAVHFAGHAADVRALRELCDAHELTLIEDCAQAVGARLADGGQVGSVGSLACYSLFSKRQLGEGGMLATNDPELAERARLLRSQQMSSVTWDRHRGEPASHELEDVERNYRIDEPRAALGLSRLRRLDAELTARREVVRAYRRELADVPGIELPWADEDVDRASHSSFLVLARDRAARDGLRADLRTVGIQTTWYPALNEMVTHAGDRLPRVEEAAHRHVALPMSATLGPAGAELVVAAIRESMDARGA